MDKLENIVGIHSCLEALKSNIPISQFYIGSYLKIQKNHNLNKLIDIAKNKKILIKYTDKENLCLISHCSNHQGVVAIVKPYEYFNLNYVLKKICNKNSSLFVILDHIKDSGNFGAIVRSAEAFGADAIVIPNKRSANVNTNSYKTSAGAIFNIPIIKVSNLINAIKILKKNDFWIAGATEHTTTNIWDSNLKGKIAIVMGDEHLGISKLVLDNCDFKVCLPLTGKTESLNVAQAFCACAYEWFRQNSNKAN